MAFSNTQNGSLPAKAQVFSSQQLKQEKVGSHLSLCLDIIHLSGENRKYLDSRHKIPH